MKILVTGAAGFVGKNLMAALENVRSGKDRTRPGLQIEQVYAFDVDTDETLLEEYCSQVDFVFHFAGVNRSADAAEFVRGNVGFTKKLLAALKECGNQCPVMFASSVQACCIGRYDGNYGRSKKTGEELVFMHAEETGAKALVYRFPNLFGKWCMPNYNSAVATFCHNIAHDLPIELKDPALALELVYIDDLIEEMLDALEGREHRCDHEGMKVIPKKDGMYCHVPVTHRETLGSIVERIERFKAQSCVQALPQMPEGSFDKKLYSTYLSYLPVKKAAVPLKMNVDERGSFTELLRMEHCGQVSVNVIKPGRIKGQHWHHSKWEVFMVVSGHGLIRMRKVDSDEVLELEVSGDRIEAVYMLPGYVHMIINLSDTENLVTVMWANEWFDPNHPDTYHEEV